MKFIHLSDLHIGKRVNEISMIDDQKYIFNKILEIIDSEEPKAVLVSGDVYDTGVPSAEAVLLFNDFLCELAKRKIEVIIISGNHDNAARLAFGESLMERAGVHISPVYKGSVKPVVLSDEYGKINFWMLPFIKPIHIKGLFPEAGIESYTDACRAAIENMDINPAERNVVLAHQFVTGAETCESEEISVGGTDNVSAEVFAPFDYVALGHLHGPQNIGSNKIRYCGTPLKYSFSERNHHKSVTVAEIREKGNLEIRLVPLIPKHDMRRIKGTFEQLYSAGSYSEDYIHAVLTDEDDIPEAVGRLRDIYPNMMILTYENTRTGRNQTIDSAEDVQQKSPIELFEEFYCRQNNREMSAEQKKFAEELIESIREEKA
ncbi:MAG: exonuclease SbcCD subunit D [Oscillospiraceae bacterium]|nr:exonuclease SbcCD subunit D [Oscillospiraceae bacterium]MBQ3501807.1 exonuclease SbcCD subunit D [Oscillospiraceae bacterium]